MYMFNNNNNKTQQVMNRKELPQPNKHYVDKCRANTMLNVERFNIFSLKVKTLSTII